MHWRVHRFLTALTRKLWALRHPRAARWQRWMAAAPHDPVITRLGGDLHVRVYPHDVIGQKIYVDGLFEPEECRFVTGHLQPGMVFFDVGANLGQYTLLAAQAVGLTGHVHSFEPSARMFAELQYNVGLNGFDARCTLNNVAVFDRPGTARLSRYAPGGEVFGSLGQQERAGGAIVGYDEVATITLDDYVVQRGIERVDLIKLDIEGAELQALRGAGDLLARPDGPVVVLEMADVNTVGLGYAAMETWDYLESLGYRLHAFDDQGQIVGAAARPRDFQQPQNLVAIKVVSPVQSAVLRECEYA